MVDDFEQQVRFFTEKIELLDETAFIAQFDAPTQALFDNFLDKYLPKKSAEEKDFWNRKFAEGLESWDDATSEAYTNSANWGQLKVINELRGKLNKVLSRSMMSNERLADVKQKEQEFKWREEIKSCFRNSILPEDALKFQRFKLFENSMYKLSESITNEQNDINRVRTSFEDLRTEYSSENMLQELGDDLVSLIRQELKLLDEDLRGKEEILKENEDWIEYENDGDAWEAKQLLRFGYRPEDFPSFSEPRDLNLEELSEEERLSIILSAARGIKLYERPLLLSSLSRKELRQYHEKKKVEIFLETGRWDEFDSNN